MKALYVTDRLAIGDEAFGRLLEELRGCSGLTVQVREKSISDCAYVAAAASAKAKLGTDVPLFVNRRFDVALAAGANGVHLPAAGLPVREVKAAAPRGFRVGFSAHSAAEAIDAIEDGADLVALGPIFETPSKSGLGQPLGPAELGQLPLACDHASEIYAIGGIEEKRLEQLASYRDRIAGVAAIRLFQEASDPRAVGARIAVL
jgi:thiamine-phosphate pyrophosphorylase